MVQLSIQNGKLVRRQNKLAIDDCCCGGGDPAAPCILSSVSSVNDLSVEFTDWKDHDANGCVPACYDCDTLLNGTHILSATADLATYLQMSNTNLGPREEWRDIWDPFVWFKSLGQIEGHWTRINVPTTTCYPGTYDCTLDPITWEVLLIATLGYRDNTIVTLEIAGNCALTVEIYFYGLSGGGIFPTRSLPAMALANGITGIQTEEFRKTFLGPVNPNLWSGLTLSNNTFGTPIQRACDSFFSFPWATCTVSSVP